MSARPARFVGFDPRTRVLRWVLASTALLLVLTATVPAAAEYLLDWGRSEYLSLPWYVTRTSAVLSYLALTGSVVYGLMLSTGATDRIAHRAVSVTLHRDLAGVGLALALIHAAVLMLDRSVPYTPTEVVVPFAGPYRPLWVAFGQLALAGSIIVTLSTYVRGRIGHGAWRRIHKVAFLAWAMATIHGAMSGTDTGITLLALMYVSSAALVVGLTTTRVMLALLKRRADSIVE
jgi:sulfoxide reductase heme-binding subunit YedZ